MPKRLEHRTYSSPSHVLNMLIAPQFGERVRTYKSREPRKRDVKITGLGLFIWLYSGLIKSHFSSEHLYSSPPLSLFSTRIEEHFGHFSLMGLFQSENTHFG